jgi:hypothetical protein
VSGQLHPPAALSPGKEPPVPIAQKAGWTPESVWTKWRRKKFYRNSNPDPSFVQPIVGRYTDYTIPAPDVNDRIILKRTLKK